MSETGMTLAVHQSISDIPAADWDRCADPVGGGMDANPFTTHRFLQALETSQSAVAKTGWAPFHLVASLDSVPIAVMPLYAKYHSYGEYVFDHSWAHAYEKAGGSYYPKLQSGIPFTPVTGRRFLTRPDHGQDGIRALLSGALSLLTTNSLSSLHITFCTGEEARVGKELGLLQRTGEQFHWRNRDYRDFDDFLAGLTSRKRRNIKKERRTAQGFGGDIECLTGPAIRDVHWDAFWCFYTDTHDRKWGQNYLTRQFFSEIGATMADDILLIMCRRAGRYIAGALNFIGRDTLYGRYWGCTESHSCLHFEACYYQAIEYAIAHGLDRIEAGAQGPHKLARGYMPIPTYSLHWIANGSFRNAVTEFLTEESRAVLHEISLLTDMTPYKQSQ
ncbi:MAG: GNAT family N-acetyltransferase [Rhodobacteraceae bacterium]|nr:GNAT family N-acetyltransferase [Paracoccaceae bacterium]